MNDQQAWVQAIKSAENLYERLPVKARNELDEVIQEIMRLKEDLVARVLVADSVNICRTCAGECCRNGKYHFTILDLLAYLSNDHEPVIPDFRASATCPYSGPMGCLMPPRFRPMTCVIFNCDLIEDRIGPDEQAELYACEKTLRDAIARANGIVGQRVDRALLLTCDT